MIKNKILKTIEKNNLINQGDSIIVGVSGGPDSICLLDILNSLKDVLKIKIYVCHVNHCLRKNAIIDEEYVINYCKKNKIQCFVRRADIKAKSKNEKIGEEEAGRNVRYEFFEEMLQNTNSNKIAVAHNACDNVETIIMNILRGSGISGLKGIEPRRNEIIRPLIECTREEIEQYCKENNLEPRHDESNDNNLYTRNKVRNVILPYIKKEFNPNIVERLNKFSNIVQDEEKFFIKILEKEYNNIIISENINNKIIIDLKKFNQLDICVKRRMILFIIRKLCNTSKGIEMVHIEDIIKLCNNNIGNKFLSPRKNLKICINKGVVEYIIYSD